MDPHHHRLVNSMSPEPENEHITIEVKLIHIDEHRLQEDLRNTRASLSSILQRHDGPHQKMLLSELRSFLKEYTEA